MATIYLRSTDGNDADDGSTWALAKATMAAAVTAAGAGGIVYVSQVHAETQASAMTITPPGTAASPMQILCVQDSAEPPTTLATTATVTTTGNNAMTLSTGHAYFYGITFSGGTGANNLNLNVAAAAASNSASYIMESCVLKNATSGSTSAIILGTNNNGRGGVALELISCTLQFGAAGQQAICEGNVIIKGGTTAGTVPTSLFRLGVTNNNNQGELMVIGMDLSSMSGILVSVAQSACYKATFADCKLHASTTMSTGSMASRKSLELTVVNCDSGDTNYKYSHQVYEGTETQETVIVRSGGASDGTTAFSRKVVSTANSSLLRPYESLPMVVWNTATGSAVTLSVPVITDGVTLTDAEAWLEVEYLGTSGYPLGSYASDRVSNPIFGTPANQATDGVSSWTTTGLSSPVQQLLSVAVTPQEAGFYRVRVMVAKASTTVYYDPYVQVS